MTKTRDLANLIADSKVGPSEIDTAGNYTMNNLTSTGRIVGVDLDLYANTDGNNSLRFYDDDDLLTGGIYPWSGRLNISSYNSQDIALSPAANVNITSGNLEVGGTTVIDSARRVYAINLQNTNPISFLNGSDGTSGTGAQGINVRHVYAGITYADSTAGAGDIEAKNSFKLAGTTVIDSSRNFSAAKVTASGSNNEPAAFITTGSFVRPRISTQGFSGNPETSLHFQQYSSASDTRDYYMGIYSVSNANPYMYFDNRTGGSHKWQHNGSTRMELDSSGNLEISGALRKSSTLQIVNTQQTDRTVRFGTYSSDGASYFGPNNDAASDELIDLGTGDGRWRNFYLSGVINGDSKGIRLGSGYSNLSQTGSGAMTILGHNAVKSDSTINAVEAVNTGYHAHFMRMYYSHGIAFHTTDATRTAGDVVYDFATPSNAVSGSGERMRITPSGNVGIGESSSINARFHVKDSISADGDTYDNPIAILQNERVNTGSGAATLRFDTNEISSTNQYQRGAISAEYDGSNNLSGRLLFGTADSSGTMRTRMRLDGNNEVKVGNNSTYTYLKVEGADANVAANIQLTHLGGGSRTGIDAIWNISRGSNETNFGTGVTTGSTALGGLVFWNTTTGVGSLDVMRLTDDGYAHFAKTVKQTYVIGGFVPNGGSLTTAKKAQIHALWASSSDRTGWGKISTHGNGNHYGALYGSNSYIYWDLYVEDCTYLKTTISWHNNADSSTRTVNLDWTEDGGSVWNTNQTTFGSSGGTNQSFTIQPNGTGGRYIRVRAKMNSSHYQLVGILGIEFTATATHFQFCNALGN